MKLLIKKGTTSKRIAIFIPDSASTTGAGKTGLLFNTASLVWYYWREDEGNAGGTAVTLATATRGTWATGGFIEKDATNLPGLYEIGIPNAALATGANWVVMMLKGASGMAPVTIEIQLVDFDPNDTVRLGLTALPNAAADASGGLITRALALPELAQGQPSATPTIEQALMLHYMALRNELSTDTDMKIRNDAGTVICKSAVADNGTTTTREKLVTGP